MSDAELQDVALAQLSCLDSHHKQLNLCRQYQRQLIREKTIYEQQSLSSDRILQERLQMLSEKQKKLAEYRWLKEQTHVKMSMSASLVSDVERLTASRKAVESSTRDLMREVEQMSGQQQQLKHEFNAKLVSVGLLVADINRLNDELSWIDQHNVEYETELTCKHEKVSAQQKRLEALNWDVGQLNLQLESSNSKRFNDAGIFGTLRKNSNYHSLPLCTKFQSLTDRADSVLHSDDVESVHKLSAQMSKDDFATKPMLTSVGDVSNKSSLLAVKGAETSQHLTETIGVSHSENLRSTSLRMLGRFSSQQLEMHQFKQPPSGCMSARVDHNSFSQKSAELTRLSPVRVQKLDAGWSLPVNDSHTGKQRPASKPLGDSSQLEVDERDPVTTSISSPIGSSAEECCGHTLLPDVVGYLSCVSAHRKTVEYDSTVNAETSCTSSTTASSSSSKVPPSVAQKPKFRYPGISAVTVLTQSNAQTIESLESGNTVTAKNQMYHSQDSFTSGHDFMPEKPQLKNASDESAVNYSVLKSRADDDDGQYLTEYSKLVERPISKPSITCPVRRCHSISEVSQILSYPSGDAHIQVKELAAGAESLAVSTEDSVSKVQAVKNKLQMGMLRRVQFEPLALLLDAALEGELDLLQRTLQVCDVSAANDEGITALHNAICAGHLGIAEYLVNYACDVNAPDNDGWTPLHCAASCNNTDIVKLLVEHGACSFAKTLSDQQKPSEKCEPDEGNYESCLRYLQEVETQMKNPGATVYAVFEYNAENADELTFSIGDELLVEQCNDDVETEWWWCHSELLEGYVPQNLIARHPRKVPSSVAVEESIKP